jgi:hypothetical protein
MPDRSEIDALKSSFRGALATSDALRAVKEYVEALDAGAHISVGDLEDLARVTLAHAVAAQALRSLVETMRGRRGGSDDHVAGP